MADAQRTIDLIFNGVDKTGAATQAALNNTKKFAGNIQDATQPIADFTTSAVKLEAGILAAGLAVTAFSVKVAGDFQSAVADLSKVLADTDNIEQYKNLAIELGESYGVASVDVLNAITNYKQAGFTAEEAGQLTKAGLDLVIAGGIEATRAADLLVASIKGFSTEAGESANIVDLLNQVSNEYAATTEQLLEGFSVLSPVAKTAGLSLQETIGILTPGIEVFQSGSEVANALRTSLLRLVDDSKPVQEGLEALGVSQRDANGELRSARDIYFDVAAALNGVDENQRIYIASQLVGIQRSSQFLAITSNLDTTLRIAGDGFEYAGSAAAEVAAQLATAESASNRAKVAFNNLFLSIGAPVLDEFTGVADAISSIFRTIGDSVESGDGSIGELVAFVESQFSGLQSTLEAVAQNLPNALELADFSGFINGIQVVTDAIGNLFGNIDLTTVEGLADAITLVGTAFESLSRFTGGVIDSFKPLFDKITGISGGLLELDQSFFETLGNIAGLATQANILAGAITSLVPSIQALVAVVGINQAVGLVGALASATAGAGALGSALSSGGLLVGAAAAGAAIGTIANKATELATGVSISTWATDTAISFGLIDDEATRIIDSINDVGPAIQSAGSAASSASGDLRGAAGAMGDLTDASNTSADSVEGINTAFDQLDDSVGIIYELPDVVSNTSVAMNEAARATAEFSTVIDSISLDEKLALIDSRTQITIAGIEAGAQTMEAAFDSVNTSIESTGDTLSSLFGLLGDENISKFDKLDLSKEIERESERRDAALALQEKLIAAQARLANAQAERLKDGGALINVNGDGLQPHLEAIMYSLFEAIQVRVNADGYELLLGTAP